MKRLLYIGAFPGPIHEWVGMPQPTSDELLSIGFKRYVDVEEVDLHYHRDNWHNVANDFKNYDYIFLGNVFYRFSEDNPILTAMESEPHKVIAWLGDARKERYTEFLQKTNRRCKTAFFTGRAFTQRYFLDYTPSVCFTHNWWNERIQANVDKKDIEVLLPIATDDDERANMIELIKRQWGAENCIEIKDVVGDEYHKLMARAKRVYSLVTQNDVYYADYHSSRVIHALVNKAAVYTNIDDRFEEVSFSWQDYHTDNVALRILDSYLE